MPALHLEDVQQTTRREAGTETVTTTMRRIYGGVTLSPADCDVHDVPASAAAEAVVTPLKEAIRHGKLLQQVDFRTADTYYRAALLPGAASRDIGGLSLEEVDLWVPAPGGDGLAFTEMYHSFHTPATAFDAGWTIDLPRLEARRLRRTMCRS